MPIEAVRKISRSLSAIGVRTALQMVSATPVVTQHNQHSLWAAPAFISLSEINFLAFDDKKDNKDDEEKGKKPPPPPPPPKRSEKCPHGDDGGHDCRDDN